MVKAWSDRKTVREMQIEVPKLIAPYLQLDLKNYSLIKARLKEIESESPKILSFPPHYREHSIKHWKQLKRLYSQDFDNRNSISQLLRKVPPLKEPVLVQLSPSIYLHDQVTL